MSCRPAGVEMREHDGQKDEERKGVKVEKEKTWMRRRRNSRKMRPIMEVC